MMIKFIVSLIIYVFYCVLKNQKQLYLLQSDKYKSENYLKTIKDIKKVWLEPSILFVALVIFMFVKNDIASMVTFIVIYMISSLFILHQNNKTMKKKLDLSKIKGLVFFNALIYLVIISLFMIIFVEQYITIYYLFLGLLIYISPITIFITNLIRSKLSKKSSKKA